MIKFAIWLKQSMQKNEGDILGGDCIKSSAIIAALPTDSLTWNSCICQCRQCKAKYVGITNGKRCSCLNLIPNKSFRENQEKCSKTCVGDGDEGNPCGEYGKTSFYVIDLVLPSSFICP